MVRTNYLRTIAGVALMAAGVAACNPMRDTHGYTTVATDDAQVEVGVDTKATLLQRLGSPSTQSTLEGNNWYYITTVQERLAFYKPQTVRRTVLAVRFDPEDRVAGVDRFGMERGQVVAYNSDRTPTRGRELGLIEQLFGNVGAATPIIDEEAQQRERR
jgi:outer membrane protein assembly factor BamE (lipoprotein component of BamABCDE complex)